MVALIISVPDDQAAFMKRVVKQMGFGIKKTLVKKSSPNKPSSQKPSVAQASSAPKEKFDDLPDAEKATDLRAAVKIKGKDIKPVLKDVALALADIRGQADEDLG